MNTPTKIALLVFVIVMAMLNANSQSKKIKKAIPSKTISEGWTDSIGYEVKHAIIPCIAYSQFNDDRLIYLKADTIIKAYSLGYLYKRIGNFWTRNITDKPIVSMSMNGDQSTEQNISYWLHGKEIYPIEIITKPIIK